MTTIINENSDLLDDENMFVPAYRDQFDEKFFPDKPASPVGGMKATFMAKDEDDDDFDDEDDDFEDEDNDDLGDEDFDDEDIDDEDFYEEDFDFDDEDDDDDEDDELYN